MELLTALHGSALAVGLRTPALYPFVNAGHILSLALLVGSIATLDLRMLGLFRSAPLPALAPPLSRMAAVGAALALVTGFLLFSVKPVGYWENTMFPVKLILVAAGLLNAGLVHASPHWRAVLAGGPVPARLKVSAALSLAIWVSAVLAGRWIAFVE